MSKELIERMKPMEAYNFAKKELEKHYGPSQDTLDMVGDIKSSLAVLHSHFIVDKKNSIKGIIPRIEEQTTKHNGRLRKLEMKYWIASGAIIVLGWVCGYAVMGVKDWTKQVQANHDKITEIDARFEK